MSAEQTSGLAKKTLRGLSWTYAAHYSGKFLVFLSTVILARLLLKEDFGVAGYAIVTINFLDVLSDLGIGAALIYYPRDPESSDTAFWLGLSVAMALFALTWLSAPLAGLFFRDDRAIDVVRVLALTFPISALSDTHEALLRKEMAFKRKFVPDIVRAVSKGVISIGLALAGFGPWSLVLGQVCGTAISVMPYWVALRWRPSFHFARKLVRPLLTYGLGIVGINVLGVVLLNADYLFVGRFLGAESLATYMLAFRIPELVILQLCGMVAGKVFFPMYAAIRHDEQALSKAFLTAMQYITLITVPLGLGMALVAQPLMLTVFGHKWVEAIPVMRAIALYAVFLSLAYNAGDIYKAQGRTILLTQISVVRVLVLIPALWWTVATFHSIIAVGYAQVIVAMLAGVLNLVVAGYILKTPFSHVMAALRPAIVSGTLMTLAVVPTLIVCAQAPALVQLVACVLVGAGVYCAALWWLQRDLVVQATGTLRTVLGGGKRTAAPRVSADAEV